MRLLFCLSPALFSVLFSSSLAFATNDLVSENANTHLSTLSALTTQASTLLAEKKFGEFVELIPKLESQREKNGFSNLSSFSEAVLELGRLTCHGTSATCDFFVKQAMKLSPSDPWISFMGAGLTTSSWDALSLYGHSFRYIFYSPTFLFKTLIVCGLITMILLSLVLTTRLMFGLVKFEFKNLSLTPKRLLIFAFLSMAGLPFGLIPTAFLWSLLLFLWMGEVKYLVQLLFLTIGWIAFLPTAENVMLYANRPEERELEFVLSRVSSPPSNKAEFSHISNPIYVASKNFFDQNFKEASNQFRSAAMNNADLSGILYSREAASEVAANNLKAAQESIDKSHALGLNSFESYHNEALIALGSADLERGRQLLAKLKDIDSARVSTAEAVGVLSDPLPISFFKDRYLTTFRPVIIPPTASWLGDTELLAPLCTFGLEGILVLIALMTITILLGNLPMIKKMLGQRIAPENLIGAR